MIGPLKFRIKKFSIREKQDRLLSRQTRFYRRHRDEILQTKLKEREWKEDWYRRRLEQLLAGVPKEEHRYMLRIYHYGEVVKRYTGLSWEKAQSTVRRYLMDEDHWWELVMDGRPLAMWKAMLVLDLNWELEALLYLDQECFRRVEKKPEPETGGFGK